VACLYAANPEYVKSKYNLPMLREIENLVAEAVEVNIPFMNPITYAIVFHLVRNQMTKMLLSLPVVIVRSRTRPESMPKLF
jgi:homocitrate synthase